MERDHREDGDWLCEQCPHQTNSFLNLKKHMEVANHSLQSPTEQTDEFNCNFCNMKLKSRQDLKKHKQENHKTFKPCRNFLVNACDFDSDCMFNHVTLKDTEQICFRCGEIFTSTTSLITHIKQDHGNIPCKNYSLNQCKFNSFTCIFSHTSGNNSSSPSEMSQNRSQSSHQVFPSPPVNLAPPVQQMQQEGNLATTISILLSQMIPQIVEQVLMRIKQ